MYIVKVCRPKFEAKYRILYLQENHIFTTIERGGGPADPKQDKAPDNKPRWLIVGWLLSGWLLSESFLSEAFDRFPIDNNNK